MVVTPLLDYGRRTASGWHHLLLLILAILAIAFSAGAATLWVAESGGTLKVSGLDGAFLLEIPEDPYGSGVVGIDSTNGNIWTYGEQRLRAFDRDGAEFLDIESSHLPYWDPNIDMAVDGDAGNVWLLLGTRIHKFDLQGTQTGVLDTESTSARIALDRSRALLWVSDGSDLRAFSAQFQQTVQIDLGSLQISFIEWDPYRDEPWVAASDKLRRYDHSGQQIAEMASPPGSLNTYFMSPDGAGGLWIASSTEIYRIDSTGAVSAPFVPFPDFSYQTIIDVAANPRDQSVWIANDIHLRRFDAQRSECRR